MSHSPAMVIESNPAKRVILQAFRPVIDFLLHNSGLIIMLTIIYVQRHTSGNLRPRTI